MNRTVPSKVFVFRIGHLGDTLVSLPAVLRLRASHPAATFTLVTHLPARSEYVTAWDVMKYTGVFQNVIFYDPKSWRSVLILMRRLRADRPDLLYYLSPIRGLLHMLRDRIFLERLCGLAVIPSLQQGAGTTAAKGAGRPLPRVRKESESLLDLIDGDNRARIPCVPASPPFLFPGPEIVGRAAKFLAAGGVGPGDRIVGLGPGSKMAAKRWPPDRFGIVGTELLRRDSGLRLVVLGGHEDRAVGRTLCDIWGDRSLNLAGETSVIESAAILKRCRFFLGNDTGTMHLAAAVGTPAISIFSARDYPGRWEPYGEGHVVLRHDPPCAGCMLEECAGMEMACVRAITAEQVLAACLAQLGERTAS